MSMEGPIDHFSLMERKASPDSFDPAGFTFDPVPGLDLLQYSGEPYGMPSLATSSPHIGYGLNLGSGMSEYTYSSVPAAAYMSSPSNRPFTPPPASSIFPGALSTLSAGELSSDSNPSSRTSRGSLSPPMASVPRAHRFNPIAVAPTSSRGSATRRRRGSVKQADDFSDDDDDFAPAAAAGPEIAGNRREEVRRQRIESEQRRRDELREGYRRLKEVLPVSNQKSSKVALLDRATTHIGFLESRQHELQARLQHAEAETSRLRSLNESLMISAARDRHALLSAQPTATTA